MQNQNKNNGAYTLKRDEFALCHLVFGHSDLKRCLDALKKCDLPPRKEKILVQKCLYDKKHTHFLTEQVCIIVSLSQLAAALNPTLENCVKTRLRDTHSWKWAKYNALKKAFERAKRAYDKNLPKDRLIVDEF